MLVVVGLSAARPEAAPPPARVEIRWPVVTSNTVLADLVSQVGRDRIQVRALAPAGTDPHTFQPTPDATRLLARSRLAFWNGAGLEEWWGKLVRGAARRDLEVVELSKGLATLKSTEASQRGGGREEAPDPHVWLDPFLVKTYVDRIRMALSRVDPAGTAAFAERAAAYQNRLDELDAWIRGEVETLPASRRKMVTFHNAFQYFAQRYGFNVRGFVVASPGKEPSAKALADLARKIKQEQIPAVFAEADFNAKLLATLAKDAGVKVVTNLYDGSLSSGPPADSYLNLMKHNVTQIVNGLR
jgi:ABC-type Zn uptake system ZnuABC Zn-binding protein ZnuA